MRTRKSKYKEPYSRPYHIYFPIYQTWKNMISRCYNLKAINYNIYGGVGIIVCNEWLNDFEVFLKWSLENGWGKGLTFDRIKSSKNYYPENCRWTTMDVQLANRRIHKDNTSGYTGICLQKGKWRTRIQIKEDHISLGCYNLKEHALQIRNDYIIKHNLPHLIQEWKG